MPFNFAELPLAATPAWATVLIATLTGLFGLLSGAAAAAGISTSHETRERFRNRMIEAADAFIAEEIRTEDELKRFLSLGESTFVPLEATDRGPDESPEEVLDRLVAQRKKVEVHLDALDALTPRLWVVFRDRAPVETATELTTKMREVNNYLGGIEAAINYELDLSKRGPFFPRPPDEMSSLDRIRESHSLAAKVHKQVEPLRQSLLRDFKREIRRRWRL